MNLNATGLWEERPETCLGGLVLDRHAVGETVGAEAAAIDEHLAGCVACSGKLDAYRNGARDFAASFFVAGQVSRVRSLAATPRRPSLPWVAAGAMTGLAAAAALVLALRPDAADPSPPGEPSPPPAIRAKGGEAFSLVARRANGGAVTPVLPGEELAAGDAVRFRVALVQAAYVAVISVDSAPEVTLYYPWEGDPERMEATTGRYLPGSIILDQVQGPEQIIAVFCPRAIRRADLLEAARTALRERGGRVDALERLDVGCEQSSLLIHKVAR